MLFSSLVFLWFFLPAVLLVHTLLPPAGKNAALLLAPAKEGVYAEKMPAGIPAVHRPTRVQALADRLRAETPVPVLFPFEELRQAAAGRQVYYKYDTHWNDAGAWLAAQQVLAALGRPYRSDWPAVAADPAQTAPTDLANMCGRWHWCNDDVYYAVDAPRAAADGGINDELLHYTGAGSGSLLLVRDSFGAALAPHLANGFAKALVLHGNVLSAGTLDAELDTVPDVLVIETAERYSNDLFGRVRFLQTWAESLPAADA